MKLKKLLSLTVAAIMAVSAMSISAFASDCSIQRIGGGDNSGTNNVSVVGKDSNGIMPIAIVEIDDFSVPANSSVTVGNFPFSVEYGDTLSTSIVYTPLSAKIKVEFVGPETLSYTGSNGALSHTFNVRKGGTYKLRFTNSTSVDATLNGYVRY